MQEILQCVVCFGHRGIEHSDHAGEGIASRVGGCVMLDEEALMVGGGDGVASWHSGMMAGCATT